MNYNKCHVRYYALFVYLIISFAANSQTVAEFADYMQTKGVDPKEYIFEAFKKHDVVILGERDHRDTTQYEFILDVLSDSYFAEEVGYVYTEVGVVNQTDAANRLIKGCYNSHGEFHFEFYRNMDYEILWDKYNAGKFIRGLFGIGPFFLLISICYDFFIFLAEMLVCPRFIFTFANQLFAFFTKKAIFYIVNVTRDELWIYSE